MNLRSFFTFCAAHGLKGVDLLDSDGYPWLWSSGETAAQCVRWAQEEGLAIAAHACGNNFAQPTAEQRRGQIALVQKAIDHAGELGAPLLRIFGGYHRHAGGDPSTKTANGLEMIFNALEQCLPHAEKRGVILALENHGCLPAHSWESKTILDHFDSPWLKALYDPANYLGNSMTEDEDPLRAYQRLKGSIAHAHFKDVAPAKLNPARRREPCVAGQGLTPLCQIIAEMVRDGYDGFCALEYEAAAIVPEMEGVPASFAFLQDARAAALLQRRMAQQL
ncbi:MAG TPA: sugar phosphate isomerase/epimerase family protein [Chthoniobacteraceae bacterium]|nr:sugar phosphate isomerase/epimerase family protein [Chthoniobacteraceae bacterium]